MNCLLWFKRNTVFAIYVSLLWLLVLVFFFTELNLPSGSEHNPISITTKNNNKKIYPHRIWCFVPTLYPDNKDNMEAIVLTWGKLCDKLTFVIDNKNINNLNIPSSFYYAKILQLNISRDQNKKDRNIWEKMWKLWKFVGNNYINDSEWFLKIDDDTFFSPINFKGFIRYFDSNIGYYIGHTLLHKWIRDNVVFNSGTCYALSKKSILKLLPIFSSNSFLYPPLRVKKEIGVYCTDRRGALEDQSIGICLRSVGIQPSNTLDSKLRQRFHIFKRSDMYKIIYEDSWFWKFKPKAIGVGNPNCCSPNSISFHAYKHNSLTDFERLNMVYNIKEGVNGKTFEIPSKEMFLYGNISQINEVGKLDEYRNKLPNPWGQFIYLGKGKERYCNNCNGYKYNWL